MLLYLYSPETVLNDGRLSAIDVIESLIGLVTSGVDGKGARLTTDSAIHLLSAALALISIILDGGFRDSIGNIENDNEEQEYFSRWINIQLIQLWTTTITFERNLWLELISEDTLDIEINFHDSLLYLILMINNKEVIDQHLRPEVLPEIHMKINILLDSVIQQCLSELNKDIKSSNQSKRLEYLIKSCVEEVTGKS